MCSWTCGGTGTQGLRGLWGGSPCTLLTAALSLQVPHLLQAVGTGVTGGERSLCVPGPAPCCSPGAAQAWRGCALQDPASRWGHAALPLYSPAFALPQLFSLQAPLKTLLQLTIMPIINGTHRGCHTGARAGAGGTWLHRVSPSLQRGLKRGCRSHCQRAWTSPRRWSPTTRYVASTGIPSWGRDHILLGRAQSHQPHIDPLPLCRDSSRWELISTSPRGCGR